MALLMQVWEVYIWQVEEHPSPDIVLESSQS